MKWISVGILKVTLEDTLQRLHAFDEIEKELENDFCIYVRAKLSDLNNFSVNPFVKNKRKLSDEQRLELSRLAKKRFSSD